MKHHDHKMNNTEHRMRSWGDLEHDIDTGPNRWVLCYAKPKLEGGSDADLPKDSDIIGSSSKLAFWVGDGHLLRCTENATKAKQMSFEEALSWAKTFKQRYGYKWACQPMPAWVGERVS